MEWNLRSLGVLLLPQVSITFHLLPLPSLLQNPVCTSVIPMPLLSKALSSPSVFRSLMCFCLLESAILNFPSRRLQVSGKRETTRESWDGKSKSHSCNPRPDFFFFHSLTCRFIQPGEDIYLGEFFPLGHLAP